MYLPFSSLSIYFPSFCFVYWSFASRLKVFHNSGTIFVRIKSYLRQSIWNPVMLVAILLLFIPGMILGNLGSIGMPYFSFFWNNFNNWFNIDLIFIEFSHYWSRVESIDAPGGRCHLDAGGVSNVDTGGRHEARGERKHWLGGGEQLEPYNVWTGRRRAHADGALAASVLHASAPFLRHLAAARAQSADGRTHGVHSTPNFLYIIRTRSHEIEKLR